MVTYSWQIARQLRDLYLGKNWTGSNLKDVLSDITFVQANEKVFNLNTIPVLCFHINYYVHAVLSVLDGGPLKASDKYSFDMPSINSEEAWQLLKTQIFIEAEDLAIRIENFDGSKLMENFGDGKYGSYYRNFTGIIEHAHYHPGQISLIKKIITQKDAVSEMTNVL